MTKYQAVNEVVDRQRTILVGVHLPERFGAIGGGDADLGELGRLTDTAGGEVVGSVLQRRDRPDGATFLGKGKLEDLQELVERTEARLVVFDNDLSPAQARNVEKALNAEDQAAGRGVSVLDRTELILDIFVRHARTRQARLQVELAQLQYMMPRLRKLWSHLERQGGGIGTRGPGETQLETDRRLVGKRIARLKSELEAIAGQRAVRAQRRQEVFTAALVGYTNAGKSTLMRALTEAEVLVEDKLFATLDATTRRVELDERRRFLLTDTVGFIRRLPHHLVESFRTTLQEVVEADLLVHVVDASDPEPQRRIDAVNDVLADIVPDARPILTVFNKLDRLEPELQQRFVNRFGRDDGETLFISALAEDGVREVRSALERRLLARERVYRLRLPVHRMDLVAVFHRTRAVLGVDHGAEACLIDVRMREDELQRLLARETDVVVVEE